MTSPKRRTSLVSCSGSVFGDIHDPFEHLVEHVYAEMHTELSLR